MSGGIVLGVIGMMIVAATTPVGAEEQSAGEAAGAGRLSREVETSAAVICGGCVTPTFAGEGRGSVPYGRIELDAIYSNRNTNPLDPGQFNGYATTACKSSNASSTPNPRFSVFGLRADRTDGKHTLTGVVEADFYYSQTDNTGSLSPRLRLVEQGLHFAARLADSYVVMAKGAVVAAGRSTELSAEQVRQYLVV